MLSYPHASSLATWPKKVAVSKPALAQQVKKFGLVTFREECYVDEANWHMDQPAQFAHRKGDSAFGRLDAHDVVDELLCSRIG